MRDAAIGLPLTAGHDVYVRVTRSDASGNGPFQLNVEFTPDAVSPDFVRGDVDGGGDFNGIADVLFLLNFQFADGAVPPCLESADVDGSGALNGIADGLYLLQHRFSGGPPPPAPYPDCGSDPDGVESLGCELSVCP